MSAPSCGMRHYNEWSGLMELTILRGILNTSIIEKTTNSYYETNLNYNEWKLTRMVLRGGSAKHEQNQ